MRKRMQFLHEWSESGSDRFKSTKSNRKSGDSRRQNRRKLRVESLEKRRLLAVMAGGEGPWAPSVFEEQALVDFHGPDLQGKDGPLSNVGLPLLTVFHEFEGFVDKTSTELGPFAPFAPSNDLIRVVNDSAVVDLLADVSGSDSNTDLTAAGANVSWEAVDVLSYELQQLGAVVTGTWGPMVSALLPIQLIPDLAGLSGLQSAAASALSSNVGLVTSQGDPAMRSDVARAVNETDGSGVTVGVLSDSFDSSGAAAGDVASGDLPEGIQVLADASGIDEGRAMMQLVADVAPGAEQAFHTAVLGQASFANGIVRLADEANADVIVDDIIYLAEPMFQDGVIGQAVDQVVAGGASYFSSSGNNGRDAYESEFRNSGLADPFFGAPQHDFDPGPGVDTFQEITVPEGASFTMVLQWDSPFLSASPASGGSPNDVDVIVYDSTNTIALNGGISRNIGGDALEIFRFTNFGGFGDTFSISISNFAGPDAGYLKYVLFADPGVELAEFDTKSGTTYGHAFANGAEAVGAAFYGGTPEFGVDPPLVETFSSAGGSPTGVVTPIFFDTNGNRLATPEIRDDKPGIVAPDGTNTTFFIPGLDVEGDGFPNFFGTSAAAPHAAGVAALMLSSAGGPGSLSPTDVYTTLRETAVDMDDPDTPGFDVGFDFATGFGLVDAAAALDEVALPPPPIVEFPTPLQEVDPAGGLIFEGSLDSRIDFAGDTDGYTIEVDPGQTITVLVETENSLQGSVHLYRLDGKNENPGSPVESASAAAAGENLLLQTVATRGQLAGKGGPNPEKYLIDVSGLDDTTGAFSLRVVLNSALENESAIGLSNDTLSTAQDLNPAFVSLNSAIGSGGAPIGQPARGAVLGSIDKLEYGVSPVPFEFNDIAGTGNTALSGAFVDDSAATLTAADLNGFEFSMFDTTYSELSFSSNGLITFENPVTDFFNTDLSTSPDAASIAPLWDDLFVSDGLLSASSAVLWEVTGSGDEQELIIQWNEVGYLFNTDTITFQAVLSEADGSIRFNYLDIDSAGAFGSGGASATVGIKASGLQGPDRLVPSFNAGPNEFVGSGQSTLFEIVASPTPDLYSFDLKKGQTATLALAGLNDQNVAFELLDEDGNVVASGLPNTNVLQNGSFETGNFSGWTVNTTGIPTVNWSVGPAGQGTGFSLQPTEPQDGQFVAWNSFDSFDAPMQFTMSQDLAIPGEAPIAELGWQDRVQWDFGLGAFATIPRTYEVQLRDPSTDAVFETLYSFSTDTQAVNPAGDTGWQSRSVDLSAYIGETVRLFIVETVPQSGTGPAQIEFDAFELSLGLSDAPTNVTDLISNFVAPESGTYFVRVAGAPGEYSLVATRSADFGIEDNDSIETAQPIVSSQSAGRQWMLGSIDNEIVTVDGFDAGWWNSLGNHNPNSQNYFTGFVPGFAELRNFVAFDVPDVPNIVDAELRLFNPSSPPRNGPGYLSDDPTETYEVFDVSTPINELVAGGGGRVDIFEDLGTGQSYASRVVSADDNGTIVTLDLNDEAINDILDVRGGQFATGGVMTTIAGNDALQRIFGFTLAFDTRQLALTVADRDFYAIEAGDRNAIEIETGTPASQEGEFENRLDPKVWLYDSSGQLVASDDNGASDGVNARLKYKVPKGAGGTFYVLVGAADPTAANGEGSYLLSVKGNSARATVAPPSGLLATNGSGFDAVSEPQSTVLIESTSLDVAENARVRDEQLASSLMLELFESQSDEESEDSDLLDLLAADLLASKGDLSS